MAKLSKTFLLIGAILSLVLVGTFIICGIVFLVFSSPAIKDMLVELLEKAEIHTDVPGTPEEQAAAIQAIFLAFGLVFMFLSLFSLASAIVAFAARKKPSTGLLVANIVLGLMSGEFNAAGGILGIIANARIERNNRRSNIVDAE